MSTSLTFLQVHKVQDIRSKRGKLSVEDFLYLIRKVLRLFTIFTNKLHFSVLEASLKKISLTSKFFMATIVVKACYFASSLYYHSTSVQHTFHIVCLGQ